MNRYLMELIGTFFLVLTIGCTGLLAGGTIFAPLAIGAVLMVMVYAGGHISGGHYNPAVSLAACMRGALEVKNLIPYMAAQLIGASLAAIIVIRFANTVIPSPGDVFGITNLVIAEFLFTFALAFVVLSTATVKSIEGNSFYGLAIGSTVMVGAFAVGGKLCAGAFNPAVALSLGLIHIASWKIVAITALANLLGGFFAALAFRLIYKENN